jgi:hypothetical protein
MSLFAIVAPRPRDYIVMRTRDVTSPAIVCVIALVLGPLSASAQPGPVRVAYAAPEGCPEGGEFAASVLARGRNVTTVGNDSGAAMWIAIETESSGGYRGTLHMGPSDRPAREVRGATCREVVDALAVVTVSSLGPPQPSASAAAPIDTPITPPPTDAKPATPRMPQAPRVASGSQPQTSRESRDLRAGNIGTAPKELAVSTGTLKFDHDIGMSLYGGVARGGGDGNRGVRRERGLCTRGRRGYALFAAPPGRAAAGTRRAVARGSRMRVVHIS